jgi:hypothetical protein
MHLVHPVTSEHNPVTSEHMLFDVRSEAVCPDCGTLWRRVLNVVKLVEAGKEATR